MLSAFPISGENRWLSGESGIVDGINPCECPFAASIPAALTDTTVLDFRGIAGFGVHEPQSVVASRRYVSKSLESPAVVEGLFQQLLQKRPLLG